MLKIHVTIHVTVDVSLLVTKLKYLVDKYRMYILCVNNCVGARRVDLYWGHHGGQWGACGPEARFVYECLASRAARNEHGSYDVKGLATSLRVSQKLASDAVVELVAVGAIVRTDTKTGRKGRPAIRIEIAPLLLDQIEEMDNPYGVHSDILKRLFSEAGILASVSGAQPSKTKIEGKCMPDGKAAPSGARGRLSASNRVLLGSLLINADRFGVVSGIGQLELERLTGFDEASLKHRLRRLMDLGFIRSLVPGLSSSIFNSGKVSSTYFLNLNHPSFELHAVYSVMVHLVPQGAPKVKSHIDHLKWDIRAGATDATSGDFDTPAAFLDFLNGTKGRALLPVLQIVLYRYASYLLSSHWSALKLDAAIEDDSLREDIRNDFRESKAGIEWDVVVNHFYRLAISIAKVFRSRFSQAARIDSANAGFSILPVAQDLGYDVITLLVWPAQPEQGAFVVLEDIGEGSVRLWPCVCESELRLQNRYDFGLLTPPKGLRAGL